ncbi:TIGR04282 family arsenosugar biosynthesis glycosyltransferase [Tissierella creatinophila]|uniref:2-phospho-L-lactate guanylyltransferase n=1 Tax=Tissierella creatinophila DSM 6911 TaxID=1123403 RepID=A0A1U7M662_TISCR|nr:TIGR04282 family arsenosugar biosynthesis glycosyltransferase [Tissierella creatinophila]OLS02765.1 2-phospho-L-lactate guanylyltransferase [Tissierella creatinophila DSM 6911]
MKDKVIIFFTRIPTLGKTKTRLESFLNKDLCVKLQTAFIKDIYGNIKDMKIDIIVNYSDHGDLEVLKDIIDREVYFLKQEGKNLGEKMHNAISFALERYNKVVLIGSDIPLLSKNDIKVAFKILDKKEIVISPTHDGGYYLIGMKRENKDIFDIKYSTSSVFIETIEKIKSIGRTYGVGNLQLDIDDKDDFLRLHNILNEEKRNSCKFTRKLVDEIMENGDKDK